MNSRGRKFLAPVGPRRVTDRAGARLALCQQAAVTVVVALCVPAHRAKARRRLGRREPPSLRFGLPRAAAAAAGGSAPRCKAVQGCGEELCTSWGWTRGLFFCLGGATVCFGSLRCVWSELSGAELCVWSFGGDMDVLHLCHLWSRSRVYKVWFFLPLSNFFAPFFHLNSCLFACD